MTLLLKNEKWPCGGKDAKITSTHINDKKNCGHHSENSLLFYMLLVTCILV